MRCAQPPKPPKLPKWSPNSSDAAARATDPEKPAASTQLWSGRDTPPQPLSLPSPSTLPQNLTTTSLYTISGSATHFLYINSFV